MEELDWNTANYRYRPREQENRLRSDWKHWKPYPPFSQLLYPTKCKAPTFWSFVNSLQRTGTIDWRIQTRLWSCRKNIFCKVFVLCQGTWRVSEEFCTLLSYWLFNLRNSYAGIDGVQILINKNLSVFFCERQVVNNINLFFK